MQGEYKPRHFNPIKNFTYRFLIDITDKSTGEKYKKQMNFNFVGYDAKGNLTMVVEETGNVTYMTKARFDYLCSKRCLDKLAADRDGRTPATVQATSQAKPLEEPAREKPTLNALKRYLSTFQKISNKINFKQSQEIQQLTNYEFFDFMFMLEATIDILWMNLSEDNLQEIFYTCQKIDDYRLKNKIA